MIRQRARKACGPCRTRKVRCNGNYPCDVCEGYGYKCDFPADTKKALKRAHAEDSGWETQDTAASTLTKEHSTKKSNDTNERAGPQQESPDDQRSFMLVEVPNRKDLVLSSSPFPESLVSRFTTIYSAVAFPRDLGQSLGLSTAPRLHPFAWHTGSREERMPSLGRRIFDQISLEETLQHSDTYFETMHPLFDFLDRTKFTRTCIAGWSLRQMPIDLEAIVCGVVALGSLFAPGSTPRAAESCAVEQAKVLLDISVSSPPSQLSLKFVMAWLLRALYLRCTTRPHLSWMATCNAMHIAEAIGLHQEFGNMDTLRTRPREAAVKECAFRRRTFWIALSLNRLFSIEYGRSPVHLDSINCSALQTREDSDLTTNFVNLCRLLPKNNHDPRKLTEEKEGLAVALQQLADVPTQIPPFALLKAEVCFSIFRKMRFLHLPLARPHNEAIVGMVHAGLLEAQSLSSTSSKWWSIISIPFHSVGVLIAMDTPASLGLLVDALKTLKAVVEAYDTYLAREALQTAEQLVRGCQEKKSEETNLVGQALKVVSTEETIRNKEQEVLGFEWPCEDDGGWMEVFFDMGMAQ